MTRRIFARTVVPVLVIAVATACGGVPETSSPQPVTSFQREAPTNVVPVPQPDMDPEALVRAFLKASAQPTGNREAARKFLTETSSAQWDDQGDSIILDDINIFVDQRSQDSVQMRLVGDNIGTLKADGQMLPATGRVETSVGLVRDGEQWRIDGPLPVGAMIDKDQFDATYRAVSLYFTDRDREHLIADPRWFYTGQDSDGTALINRLIAGPAEDLEAAVTSALPDGLSLRGPVVPQEGGGVQVELAGVGNLGERERMISVAQIVWTLSGADVPGPYLITGDGAPLVQNHDGNWQTGDLRAFDPNAPQASAVGVNFIRDGALIREGADGPAPVSGELGTTSDLRSAAISPDGTRVAAVMARPGDPPRLALEIGSYGETTTPVIDGVSVTRPSFGADQNSVWAVVDGRPLVWVLDPDDGGVRAATVDAAAIGSIAPGPISELQIAPGGVRAALIVDGQVIFATVAINDEGQIALTNPRVGAYNIGGRVMSLDWASPTMVVVAREEPESPVVQLSVDGTPAVGLVSGNVSPPVRAVVANQTTIYIGDQRGVLRLGSRDGQPDQYWTEVESAMGRGVIPVLP